MTIDMSQFYQVFFDEAEELLAEMEQRLLALDVEAPIEEDLHAIFRAAHSIKGGAATFGFTDITEVTHVLESLLDRIRKHEMALTTTHVDAFLAAKDVLSMLLAGHRSGEAVDQAAVASVSRQLTGLSAGEAENAPGATAAQPVSQPVQATGQCERGADGLYRLCIDLPPTPEQDIESLASELALMGTLARETREGGLARFRIATTEDADTLRAVCAFVLDADALAIYPDLPTDASTVAEPAAKTATPVTDATPSPKAEPPSEARPKNAVETKPADVPPRKTEREAAESSSIRVSVEKVDQLINLVGELVITQAMIDQRIAALDPIAHERLLNSASQLARNTRDLQEAVMSIRMLPMDYVFSRFPRMVRDLAGKLGKKVELVPKGAATELDKGLIERIVDPLTHLVRNSIDHGIETPEKRRAAGKSETGRLTLSAAHQGGNIVIEVSDDGAGLDRTRILAKARQNGLAVHDGMSDAEVWQLIFAPGFSTAEVVTDVSGRGVGMDVVKRNITAMGGVVDIRSVPGSGTTISISLPLTLAILDGMLIRVGGEIYILPLAYVIESLQPATADVKEIAGQGRVVKVRDEYLPLIPLYQLFAIEPASRVPSDCILVILESEGRKAALMVDHLVGQQQVVVKNLESNFRKVAGISGATILGDGGVSLILDVSALLRASRQIGTESLCI